MKRHSHDNIFTWRNNRMTLLHGDLKAWRTDAWETFAWKSMTWTFNTKTTVTWLLICMKPMSTILIFTHMTNFYMRNIDMMFWLIQKLREASRYQIRWFFGKVPRGVEVILNPKIYVADFGNFEQGFLSMTLIQNSNIRVQGMFLRQLYWENQNKTHMEEGSSRHNSIRDGSRYQIGWIFGKVPNGSYPPPTH